MSPRVVVMLCFCFVACGACIFQWGPSCLLPCCRVYARSVCFLTLSCVFVCLYKSVYICIYIHIYIYIHIVHYRTLQMKQRLLLICVVNLLRYACFGTYIRRYAHCFYRPTKLPPPPNKRCLCRPTDMPLPPDKHAFAARQTCLCHPTSSINQSYIINSPITPIGSGRDYSLTRLA